MKKNIQDLKSGDRFFYGMWYDFVSCELIGNCYRCQVTNGFDDNQFLVVAHKDDTVQVSSLTPIY